MAPVKLLYRISQNWICKIEGVPLGTPSIFIFKSSIRSIQLQQSFPVYLKAVIDFAGRMLINGTVHGATYGCLQGMSGECLWFYGQCEISLSNEDLTRCDAYSFAPR